MSITNAEFSEIKDAVNKLCQYCQGLLDDCNACALKKIEDDAEQNTEVLDEADDDDDIDSDDYSFIPGSGNNTKFNYLYRDASNYKVWNEFVIEGQLTEEQADKIIECCYGEYFKPHMVGMPEKTFVDLGYSENEDDVEFFELGGGDICMCDIFSYTDEDSSGITCEQLVENFVNAKEKNWEE